MLHYDATGRIIASQDSLHGQRETFTYDAAANLLDGPAPSAGLVVHNKLLTYQDKRYRYDAFGRMIEKRSAKRGVQHFAYDAESRLIEVRSDNGSVVKMAYDPLGRRIAKTEHDSNGYPLGETRFTWDGLRLLQEHRHQQTSLYLYEDNGYEPLARVDGSGPLQRSATTTTTSTACRNNSPKPTDTMFGRPRIGSGAIRWKRCASRITSKSRICGSRGSTWTGKPGCISIRSGFMIRMWGGLLRRIRLGWKVG